MNKYILLTVLALALMTPSASAQLFPTDKIYESIPPPNNVVIPDYGQSVMDNSNEDPIKITRVTEIYNYNDGNGDPQVWYPTHEYAKTQVWNADQTLYKVSSWKVYDAANYEEVQELSSMYPSYWSNTNADLIWSFRDDGDIKKYTVSTNTSQTVANIPGYEIIKLGPGEANMDKNDHYVALVGKKDNGAGSYDLDVIVYDLQANQIVTTKNFPLGWDDGPDYGPKYIDWVSISQSGDYVVIMWNHNTSSEDNPFNGHYGVEVYNTLDMQYQNRIMSYGNHGDLGYAIDGDEVLVQFYGWYGNGTIYMHKLNGDGSTVLNTHTDIGVTGHISCRNINRPGWAYVTESELAQSAQMFAIKLDDSGIVEHFGHHFSSALSYEQAAMAVASPNGDKICFKSDFGTDPTPHSEVAYSFFAEVDNSTQVVIPDVNMVGIYPNPVSDVLFIDGKETINSIKIVDLNGLVKLEETMINEGNSISISNLTSGVYFIQINAVSGMDWYKIVVE